MVDMEGNQYNSLNKIYIPVTMTHGYLQIGKDCFLLEGRLSMDMINISLQEAEMQVRENENGRKRT